MNDILQIESYGRIKQMPFPEGWVKMDEAEAADGVLAVKYPGKERVCFGFYRRPFPLNKVTAIEFLTVLQMEPHLLTEYEQEIMAIVLRTMADPELFSIDSLETIRINDQMVLKIDGIWLSSSLYQRGFFINVDDSGEFVQELHFFAPQKDFFAHLPEVMESVNAIEWRPQFDDNYPHPPLN